MVQVYVAREFAGMLREVPGFVFEPLHHHFWKAQVSGKCRCVCFPKPRLARVAFADHRVYDCEVQRPHGVLRLVAIDARYKPRTSNDSVGQFLEVELVYVSFWNLRLEGFLKLFQDQNLIHWVYSEPDCAIFEG